MVQLSADYFGIPVIRTDRDWALPGHGHMLLLERGNLELAERIAAWLEQAAHQRQALPR